MIRKYYYLQILLLLLEYISIRQRSLVNKCFKLHNYTHILANVHMWIQLPQNRGPLSNDPLMQRLIMPIIIKRDESGPYKNTSKEHVDADHFYPTNNVLRFKIEKRHACTFTGAIQVICRIWNLVLIADAFADKPIHRHSHNILSRMKIRMNQKYPSRRYISRL